MSAAIQSGHRHIVLELKKVCAQRFNVRELVSQSHLFPTHDTISLYIVHVLRP